MRLLRRRPIVSFFVLAFAWSWGVFGVLHLLLGAERLGASRVWHVPFAWGPPLAALAVVRAREGDALRAALVIGVAFGVWHLPWVLLGGAGYEGGGAGALLGLTVFTVLASLIFAWLFNGSGGVVPVVMLAHATVNVGSVVEPAGPLPGWLPDTQIGSSCGWGWRSCWSSSTDATVSPRRAGPGEAAERTAREKRGLEGDGRREGEGDAAPGRSAQERT